MSDSSDIPDFPLFGDNTSGFDESVQPTLDLRGWTDLSETERSTVIQELSNKGWMGCSSEILHTVEYLNHKFLRLCPGKNLHETQPESREVFSDYRQREAAEKDFYAILNRSESEALIMRMISKFAKCFIENNYLIDARQCTENEKRRDLVDKAYNQFDRFANCLNHIFEQFAVNQILTRNGLVPRQDPTIEQNLYRPALQALADPRWKAVNDMLHAMFEDYREGHFAECITKAHSAIHSYLQVIAGEPGQNAKGEVGKLMNIAKKQKLIPINKFTEPFLNNIQSFISAERAAKSTAKPAIDTATSLDALLMMNITMVFLQHCMQFDAHG